MGRLNRVICVVIFALGLTACATKFNTIPTDFALGAKEESVVIGRVTIIMGTLMGLKPIGFFERLGTSQLTVENEATGEDYVIVCDKSGPDSNFYVALPPGQYRFSKWERGNLTSPLAGRFGVGTGQVVYIGTLKWARRQDAGSFVAGAFQGPGGSLIGDWQVEDEYEDAVKSFRGQYPQISQEVVRSLIAH
jgi:hypothetical protein